VLREGQHSFIFTNFLVPHSTRLREGVKRHADKPRCLLSGQAFQNAGIASSWYRNSESIHARNVLKDTGRATNRLHRIWSKMCSTEIQIRRKTTLARELQGHFQSTTVNVVVSSALTYQELRPKTTQLLSPPLSKRRTHPGMLFLHELVRQRSHITTILKLADGKKQKIRCEA
jgi:hypothetical protein